MHDHNASQATLDVGCRRHWRHDIDIKLYHLVRIPPAKRDERLSRFREGYASTLGQRVAAIRDPALRDVAFAESKAEFCKVWKRWRRRSPALYPESLRDQLLSEAESLAGSDIKERSPGTDGGPGSPPVGQQLLLPLENAERAEPVDEPLPTLLHGGLRKAKHHRSFPPKRPDILEQLPLPLPPAPFKPVEVEQQLQSPPLSSPPAPTVQDIADRNLAAALSLARAGIPIFPVRLVWNVRQSKWNKPPAIDGWQDASTTDLDCIRAWWRDLPRALGVPVHHLVAGVWCGHPDLRLIVIDADRHGGPDGVAAFAALTEQNGLPFGPVTKTPTDGRHYFYKKPHDATFGDAAGSLPDGIDVRGSGFVVGPGSVRPDGAVWKSEPSLVEMKIIPELPDWLAVIIRTPKEKLPKKKLPEKKKPEPKPKSSPSTTPARKALHETCEKWAATALRENCDSLAATKPGCRNNLTNNFAFRMGRMVGAGWIAESVVIADLLQACEDNGKIQDDGGSDKIRATIASGLNAGRRNPLKGLPERPKHSWQPIDGDDDNMWVRSLRSEIRALYRIRFPGSPAAIDTADERLFEIIKTTADPWIIGSELRLTNDEYKRLSFEAHGRRRGARLPARMRPCDVSREVVEAYLKDRKRAQNLASQTAKRAKKKAEQQFINDLDEKDGAILTFLRHHPGPQSIDDICKGIKRSRAFKGMKPGSIKNAIRHLIDPPSETARNLSRLLPLITVTRGIAKNHGCKLFAEIREKPI